MNFQLSEEGEEPCKAAVFGSSSLVISYISQLVIRYLQIALLWMVNRSKLKNHKKVRKSRTIALPTMKVRGTHSSMLILMSLKEPAELLSVVLDVHQQEVS